jgi:hypothetical protein
MEKKLISEINRTLKLMNITESAILLNEANLGPELELLFNKMVPADADQLITRLKGIYPDNILNSADKSVDKLAKFIAGDATKLEAVLDIAIKDSIIPVTRIAELVEKNAPKTAALIKDALQKGVDFKDIEAQYGARLQGLPISVRTELYRSLQAEIDAASKGIGATLKDIATTYNTILNQQYPELAKKSWFGLGKPYFEPTLATLANDFKTQLVGKSAVDVESAINKALNDAITKLKASGQIPNVEMQGLEGSFRKMGQNILKTLSPIKMKKDILGNPTNDIATFQTIKKIIGELVLFTYTYKIINASIKNKGFKLQTGADVISDDLKTVKNWVSQLWSGTSTETATGTQQDFTNYLLGLGYTQQQIDGLTIKDLGNGKFVVNGKTFVYNNGTFVKQ